MEKWKICLMLPSETLYMQRLTGYDTLEQRKKHLKQLYIKVLVATAFFAGAALTFVFGRSLYLISIDPYLLPFPWGNTKENPWFYESPLTYSYLLIGLLIGLIPGLTLMAWGQIKQQRKAIIVGAGLIVVALAVSLITGVVK
jgi:hypothetical protein